MPDVVLDLDVLRPAKRIVKLGGNEIDCSFVPLAITFDLEEVAQKMTLLNQEEVEAGGPDARKGFDLAVELCSIFCAWKHPDMTVEWFSENVDANQLNVLATEIREALQKAYEGIDSKNV